MDSTTWGSPLWDLLFTLTYHHPNEKHEEFNKLFFSLMFVLPCAECQKSYIKFVTKKNPIKICSDDEYYSKWLWTVKDMVNQKLGKPYVSYSVAKKKYGHFCSLTNETTTIQLLLIMSEACEIANHEHLMNFSKSISILGTDVFDNAFCEKLFNLKTGDLKNQFMQIFLWVK